MTVQTVLRDAVARLRAAEIADPQRDARLLLAHAMGVAADRLMLMAGETVPTVAQAAFDRLILARLQRQPISQITGLREFMGHPFRITPDVLDPRPETETLVIEALTRPFVKLLDLGTGSGCILLSCLMGMPIAQGLGVDISEAALQVARDNADSLGLGKRAQFVQSDWFQAVPGRYDLIVSNPPYIAASEMAGLSPDVREWEPHLALTPGGDGLDAYRAIARGAPSRLMAGGRIIVEIGPTQGAAVTALFAAQGLTDIRILPDLDGRDRVVTAVKPAEAAG